MFFIKNSGENGQRKGEKWLGGDFPRKQNSNKYNDALLLQK